MKNRFAKITSVLAVILMVSAVKAQNIQYTLLSSSYDNVVVRVDYLGYSTAMVDVNGVPMQNLVMDGADPLLVKGNPELLHSTFSLITPENGNPEIQIIDEQYSEVSDFELAPSKGMLYRNVDPETVPYQKNSSYNTPRYILGSAASVGNSYILRDFHGTVINTYPFDYNPVAKTLKIYSSVTFKVIFNGNNTVAAAKKNNVTFDKIYERHFLNYTSMGYRSAPITEEGSILIISPEQFLEAMQPYVEWKTKIGYSVEIVDLSTVGNNHTAIKNYITDYYNSHNLAFVVIVGDKDQFPTPTMHDGKADNYFTEIAGNDYYPDIILGKISAETVSHVETQIERFLTYEKNPTVADHLPVFCGIASSEGGSYADNGERDYEHIGIINDKLLAYTYTSGYALFDGTHGGLDAPGNPSASDVSAAVNAGVGVITYCGHGNWDSWSTTNFSNSDINNLNNNGKLPFIISVACINGDYAALSGYGAQPTCFAETWLRATKNGEPTGAVGFLGSTINQPWAPPMRAQDEMIDILVDTIGSIKKLTYGAMFFNGMIKMLDNYSSENVSRTWILFGDPTLLMRTDVPEVLTVEHQSIAPVGLQDFNFTSAAENAKISVVHDGNIIFTDNITNGETNMQLEQSYTPTDTLFVTATAFNHIPYEGVITFIPGDGAYLICKKVVFKDESDNETEIIRFGETFSITPTFSNIGADNITNAKAYLSTEDEYITITSNVVNIGSVEADTNIIKNNAFEFSVSTAAPDNHNATLKIMMVFDEDTTYYSKTIKIRAASPEIMTVSIDDSENGNGNGRVDFGEQFKILVTVGNKGGAKSAEGELKLSNPTAEFTTSDLTANVDALEPEESTSFEFQLIADSNVVEQTIVYVDLAYATGSFSANKTFRIKIGSVVEDWESAGFSSMEWQNNSARPWIISTQQPYQGNYCAKSGSIYSNGNTVLSISIDCAANDSISFYYKVSSEQNYDFLTFSIDGTKKDEWSGNIGWSRAAYTVDSGSHTFTWKYSKDYYGSAGSDCAWIDDIVFPMVKRQQDEPEDPEDSDSVGIANQELYVVQVYPNPANDYIYIKTADMDLSNATSDIYLSNATYRVRDISGKLLCGGKIVGDKQIVSLSNLTAGVYLLDIVNAKGVIKTQKIIKR